MLEIEQAMRGIHHAIVEAKESKLSPAGLTSDLSLRTGPEGYEPATRLKIAAQGALDEPLESTQQRPAEGSRPYRQRLK